MTGRDRWGAWWLAAWLWAVASLWGCGPYIENPVPLGAPGTRAPFMEEQYRIHAGDNLDISFFYNPDLNRQATVRPDGRISLPLIHEIKVAGLTPAQLTYLLTKRYEVHLQDPEINVVVNAFTGHKIYVGGEVGGGGIQEIAGPTTLLQAIMASGGFRETARIDEVVVVRRTHENRPLVMTVDLRKVMQGTDLSQDIMVRPYDIVLVPRSNIAAINLWVDQYIRQLIFGLPRDFASQYLFYQGLGGTGGN